MNKIRVFDYLIYFTIIVNIVLLVLLLNGRKGNQHFEDVITRLNLKTEQVKSFQEMVILQMLNDGVEQPLKSELIDIYNNKIKLNDLHNGVYEFNDIDNYQLPCIKLDEKGNALHTFIIPKTDEDYLKKYVQSVMK